LRVGALDVGGRAPGGDKGALELLEVALLGLALGELARLEALAALVVLDDLAPQALNIDVGQREQDAVLVFRAGQLDLAPDSEPSCVLLGVHGVLLSLARAPVALVFLPTLQLCDALLQLQYLPCLDLGGHCTDEGAV
jgi:hypothetical protein